jgi:hypothetical protein
MLVPVVRSSRQLSIRCSEAIYLIDLIRFSARLHLTRQDIAGKRGNVCTVDRFSAEILDINLPVTLPEQI